MTYSIGADFFPRATTKVDPDEIRRYRVDVTGIPAMPNRLAADADLEEYFGGKVAHWNKDDLREIVDLIKQSREDYQRESGYAYELWLESQDGKGNGQDIISLWIDIDQAHASLDAMTSLLKRAWPRVVGGMGLR